MFDVPSEWSLPAVQTVNSIGKKKKKTKNKKQKTIRIDRIPITNEPKVHKPASKHTDQKFVQSKTKLIKPGKTDFSGARFRYLNEKLYTMDSSSALTHFTQNPEDFERYHEGFANQVSSWPTNPVDIFIERLLKGKQSRLSVVDLGCGEGKLGLECSQKHNIVSIDLVALYPHITVGDMCNLPNINSLSVDLVIFCLSLMNTNFVNALQEAHRILKNDGKLWIAEVASRFEKGPDAFAKGISKSFKLISMNTDNPVFVLFEFVKLSSNEFTKVDDRLNLTPCYYKKR